MNLKIEHGVGLCLLLLSVSLIVLSSRPPTMVVTQYVTQYATQSMVSTITSISSLTTTSKVSVTATSIQQQINPTIPTVNQQYCGYPFNPAFCNEGPPVTITGYLTTDGRCTFLYAGTGANFVIWNLPKSTKFNGQAVQVYGFIYPNWPQGQPFPPKPFQQTVCVGTPMWSIPPYAAPA